MVCNLPKHPSNSKRIDIFMFHATGRMRIAVSDIGSGSCCSTWVYLSVFPSKTCERQGNFKDESTVAAVSPSQKLVIVTSRYFSWQTRQSIS